jgi:dipeptidyl-peptidase-3
LISSPENISIWERIKIQVYALEPESHLLLGYPGSGHVSAYYSSNITKEDNELVQAFLGLQVVNP